MLSHHKLKVYGRDGSTNPNCVDTASSLWKFLWVIPRQDRAKVHAKVRVAKCPIFSRRLLACVPSEPNAALKRSPATLLSHAAADWQSAAAVTQPA